ncbi:hypothetical protein LZ32DRAFT_315740 [Colletotrichum eremochloae]|nr:hypothetical protein LZ32DRAFT_315740 [Colletotrichum eremochloae]
MELSRGPWPSCKRPHQLRACECACMCFCFAFANALGGNFAPFSCAKVPTAALRLWVLLAMPIVVTLQAPSESRTVTPS